MGTIKQCLSLMKEGAELTITRAISSRIGTIALRVDVVYAVGKESITGEQFKSIKARHKLSKNMDKSTSAVCYFKLSTL